VDEYGTAREATLYKNSMAHAHWLLEKYGYRHTLRICNTYCFSTSANVTGRRLNVACIRMLLGLFNTLDFDILWYSSAEGKFECICWRVTKNYFPRRNKSAV